MHRLFIEGVRKHPCLWNPDHPDYRETQVKDEAWKSVVIYFNNPRIPNIQVAKAEWKKLRDNHRDALKRAKLGKNKLLPAQITTWKYAKAMQFLEPHMKYRVTENIEMDYITGVKKEGDMDVSVTTESVDHTVNNLSDSSTNKARYNDRVTDSPPPKARSEDDALESFFHCIMKSTKAMPAWMQTQVKKKIFAIVIEAEECLSTQVQNTKVHNYDEELTVECNIKSETIEEDDYDCT